MQRSLRSRVLSRLQGWRRIGLLLSIAMAVTVVVGVPAHASDVIPVDDPANSSVGRGVSLSGTDNVLPPCRDPHGDDCTPGPGGGGTPGPFGCDLEVVNKAVTRGEEFGGQFSRITWRSNITCTGGFGLQSATLQTYVIDRTPGHLDGQRISQVFAASSPVIAPGLGLSITVDGFVDLFDVSHPNGQQVEIVLEDFEQTSGAVLQCNPSAAPELRLISCAGNHSLWGSNGFSSNVAPFCPRGSALALPHPLERAWRLRTDVGLVLAQPTASVQWCTDNSGNVTKAEIISTRPNIVATGLTGLPTNVSLRPVMQGGKQLYQLNFIIPYSWDREFTVGGVTLYKSGDKCQVDFQVIYGTSEVSTDGTTNPCDPWIGTAPR